MGSIKEPGSIKKLALDFARWLSPDFAVAVDEFTVRALEAAREWRQERLRAKTGYLPLTEAIQRAHKNPKFYHYSNEADLINKIIFNMTAKQIRERYNCEPRDLACADQLDMLEKLQRTNTALIEIGMDY